MQRKEYHLIYKQDWPRGEWDSEPDKVQWQDEATGLPCLIVRADVTGALCGYVGLGPGHPYYAESYSYIESEDEYPEVHGGLTYAAFCSGSVCHEVEEGEEEKVWWLGFDCAHCMDLSPAFAKMLGNAGLDSEYERYKTLGYVRGEVESLARQLKKVETHGDPRTAP